MKLDYVTYMVNFLSPLCLPSSAVSLVSFLLSSYASVEDTASARVPYFYGSTEYNLF